MTQSVADKTPIPAKVWRRHTDPPGLWISVVVGSVSLHLLVFWLMRSSNAFSLWFPQQNQSTVPVELIDIAPKTKSIIKSKSTPKTVSSKPLSSTQKSVPARTMPINKDFGAIDSADNFQKKNRIYVSRTNKQPFRQQRVPTPKPRFTPTPIASTTPKPKPRFTPTPIASATPKPKPRVTPTPIASATPKPKPRFTPTPTPTVPIGNIPWKRRQEIKLGNGTPLPTGIPSNRPVSKPENRETPATPTRETPATSTRETPATPTGGASVAIVDPLSKDEVIKLIQSKGFRQDALPDVIALYRGSSTKQLDSSFIVHNSGLEPAQLLASLIIDNNGKFQQAVVLEIEPATLQSEKSTYEQVLSEVFKTENFIAAHNNDGTKPELSNLYVRIKIQTAN
jgi:hypothetical protein